jgi:predicted transcriptional regulator of viral defense system
VKKKIYLTPGEQALFSALSSRHIIDTASLQEVFPDIPPLSLNKTVANLAKKGYLHRVKNGVFTVSGIPSENPEIQDPLQIALMVCPGYIGFSSALRIYDLIPYEPFTVFVVTKKRSRETTIGEYTLRCVAMGKRCTGMTFHKGAYVSTLEKTFFDCFYKPQYAGGYAVITQALSQSPSIDWQKFCDYFSSESSSLCQRTGYILDLLNTRTGIVPETVLQFFRNRIKNNTRLAISGTGSGTYVRSWMLVDNIGTDNIFSWWSHG